MDAAAQAPRPTPARAAQHLPTCLSFCGGVRKMARVALYSVNADGQCDTALWFEAIAEFDSFEAASAAVRAADATLSGLPDIMKHGAT